MASAVRRLLDELSWEGNARKYRGGGLGLENVLTTEVFQALDFLPRDAFLGAVLRAAAGADAVRDHAAAQVERAVVDVLPGDLIEPDLSLRVQPDVVISSPSTYVFVEAKRIRSPLFSVEQVARELLVTAHHSAGRQSLLLLVLGTPPPLRVKGHGAAPVDEALQLGVDSISARLGRELPVLDAASSVAYVTWSEIAAQAERAGAAYRATDDGAGQTVQRLVASLTQAVRVHG
ncbi:hypothetical protein [Nocardioides sp. AX2bis]|uniref:hypothetical protein n=1 Tax=Nocardioides sp. AX2bis TaxID=2653157 RepID=UPI0012F21629|nr:hypothetical protein [Nocardioides sp. AX2bis]VXB43910.1 conserved hypothetical protein [Nocardioides sp. AX2bis]